MNYSDYLQLPVLLRAQHPLTPSNEPDLRDSERLFIVVHQASEILLSQALTDLRHITEGGCGEECAGLRSERAVRAIDAISGLLLFLKESLLPDDFLSFRDRFGSASGLQSVQFRELFALVGEPAAHAGPRAAVQRWRSIHLRLVRHMIGDQRSGSGNTAGVRFLTDRLDAMTACPALGPLR